jgi:type I restriction-modification system DNA methylase subunit
LSSQSVDAVLKWRQFAAKKIIPESAGPISWDVYSKRAGKTDEERIIQPVAFPAFAKELLDWDLTINLAAEASDKEGQPDFTPADAVTHPFVFETKGTDAGVELLGHNPQVIKYLEIGAPRIKQVVLTNLIGLRVFDRDDTGSLRERYSIHLLGLLSGDIDGVGNSAEAEKLGHFIDEFSRKELTREEKLDRVREAPEWNRQIILTSPDWIVSRVGHIVDVLTSQALSRIRSGALTDSSIVYENDLSEILSELQSLARRLGVDSAESITLDKFLDAHESSDLGKALRQFAAHVAFYATAKLLLVRVWEDLGMLEPMLYDGGFKKQMTRFDNVIRDVISHAFTKAKERYRPLFDQRNAYSWFSPDDDSYADIIYELSNTYFGQIESDVLGQVYERMLERIDRKLLGVYYTPRDIISLIWDLVGMADLANAAEAEGRTPRILDVATGSGGFLVEAAARLRQRLDTQVASHAQVDQKKWLADVADGLNGVEYQRFAAYLAELNLIVQLGHVLAQNPNMAIPGIGIISADTVSLHEPEASFFAEDALEMPSILPAAHKLDRMSRLKDAEASDFLMDAVVGNPPYIGEKLAAPLLKATRIDFPYWNNFVGPHMDYLYWFLILGVSKLRDGGRFGFITTEYWLRAEGAWPLRKYLAENVEIERIILFREFRLFPDAPGQHSMIVIGTRKKSSTKHATVSIYRGVMNVGNARNAILHAIKNGKTAAQVETFSASSTLAGLGRHPWDDLILTRSERRNRKALLKQPQISLRVSKGVETTLNALKPSNENLLTGAALQRLGGPGGKYGIQLLSHAEVIALGQLNENEELTLRRVANTRDVYPYAVVIPADADRILYLSKPDGSASTSDDAIISATSFPDGLPKLKAYLEHFKPLLETVTKDRNERRPWWSLHRPRVDIVGAPASAGTAWGSYALTTRWGNGGRLVVGLAPANSSPASGLHLMRPDSSDVSPAYLVGLYCSTLYQEIALSLPPGQLRQADLERLGLPHLGAAEKLITDAVMQLADLVTDLVVNCSKSYPALQDALRTDVAFANSTSNIWTPVQPVGAAWGPMESLEWLEGVSKMRALGTRIGDVTATNDLLGHVLTLRVRNEPQKVAAELHLHSSVSAKDAAALMAAIRGKAETGGTLKGILEMQLPTKVAEVVALKLADDLRLENLATNYRTLRKSIDDELAAAL